MRSVRPHRLLAGWLALMFVLDFSVLFLNRIIHFDLLPEPSMAEVRWTLFYALLELIAAFNLWRADPFGWRAAFFGASLRIVEGTAWEVMNPIHGAALLATGVGLIYNGLILSALNSKPLRRVFPDRTGPFPFLGTVSTAVRVLGSSLVFYHFAGKLGAAVPPLLWFVFFLREKRDIRPA